MIEQHENCMLSCTGSPWNDTPEVGPADALACTTFLSAEIADTTA